MLRRRAIRQIDIWIVFESVLDECDLAAKGGTITEIGRRQDCSQGDTLVAGEWLHERHVEGLETGKGLGVGVFATWCGQTFRGFVV
jgi:hypothetical protein